MENKHHIYYLSTILLLLCAISTSAHAQFGGRGEGYTLANLLNKLKVSPDIVSVDDYINVIKVELNGNNVKPGDPVPAKNFKDLNMAKISWEADSTQRYTVLLLDLDRRPGNVTHNIYNQFTSVNVPGYAISAGQNIVAFEPPIVPCNPTVKHRILMLALEQSQTLDISDIAYIAASSGQSHRRENFKLGEFVKNHRLNLVAANIFQAIGETSGVCSGSSSIYSIGIQQGVSILIAMVMAVALSGFSGKLSLL